MISWRIYCKEETESTNIDARVGAHGDVFTANYQHGGRGRLDHKWHSSKGMNLLMSVVVDVGGIDACEMATLPLAVGLGVAKAVARFAAGREIRIKWPNDVYLEGKKVAGILCELNGKLAIVGIGVNVKRQEFTKEIAEKAIALGVEKVENVREAVLEELGKVYERWYARGFAAVYEEITALDALKGKTIKLRQTDDDNEPVVGVCGGIGKDGSLNVGGRKMFAGEVLIW